MTGYFAENLSFASLIAPVAEEEFRARYWEQQPLIIHREDPGYYGDMFTLRDVDQAIMRSPEYVKISDAVVKKSTSYVAPTVSGLEAMISELRNGSTLVMDHVELREPKLGMICRVLAQELGHRFQTNLYLTPPHGKGSIPHWDNHDVFILQVQGSKCWTIERERRTFPGKGDKMGTTGREFQGELNTFTLNRGDLIYIPRGFVHAAECGADASLHVTIGVVAFFLEDLVYATIKAAIQSNEGLRRALPLRFMSGRRQDLITSVQWALQQAMTQGLVGPAVDLYRDQLIQSHNLDVSGQIVDVIEGAPLELQDVVCPRRGVVYRSEIVDQGVCIKIGTRSITFPDFFREATDFALGTPAFAIRDIPGDLEDDERIVFIERLMDEGLIVRK